MKLEVIRKKISGIIRKRKENEYEEKPFSVRFVYADSDEPEILKLREEEKPYAIAFNDNGKRYIFSNNDGHEVFFEQNNQKQHPKRPMTRKEFEEIKEKMIEKSTGSANESTLLAEIEKLDFAKGHANAVFDVLTYITETNKIRALAININFSRYIYTPKDEKLILVDTSYQNPTTEVTDETEKKEITKKMLFSKTMQKRIKEVYHGRQVK